MYAASGCSSWANRIVSKKELIILESHLLKTFSREYAPEPLVDILGVLPTALRHRLLRKHLWVLREIASNPETLYSLETYFENNTIFFRIPKTAGQSVSFALFGTRGAGHINVKTAKLLFGKRNFENFFKFCIVRNPWDRLVSAYTYLSEGGSNKVETAWINENISRFSNFREFVKQSLPKEEVLREQHFRPQYTFVTNRKGEVEMDFIGRLESLERDFDEISDKLGLEAQLPHVNPSKRSDYRSYYDDETAELAGQLYQKDIEMFGYRFGG